MSNQKIKAVFFDIDGTLLSFKTHEVPQSTEKAIEKLKSKNIKVIVSTGRSINSIDHVKYLEFDGYITFNGGYCITEKGLILRKQTMDKEDIKRVVDLGRTSELSFSFMSEKDITLHRATPEIERMYASLNLPVPPIMNLDQVNIESVLQTNIFIQPDREPQFMKTVMPNSLASRWTPVFADVNPKGQSKRVGIDVFCDYFDFELSETMAFGDGGNDIEMLKHVNVGVAMGNANPDVKDIADYVTQDVDQDGIWNALKQFEVL